MNDRTWVSQNARSLYLLAILIMLVALGCEGGDLHTDPGNQSRPVNETPAPTFQAATSPIATPSKAAESRPARIVLPTATPTVTATLEPSPTVTVAPSPTNTSSPVANPSAALIPTATPTPTDTPRRPLPHRPILHRPLSHQPPSRRLLRSQLRLRSRVPRQHLFRRRPYLQHPYRLPHPVLNQKLDHRIM